MTTMAAAALAASLTCAPYERVGRRGDKRLVVRCETARAIVDFEPEGLEAAARERFARLVDRGIADLEKLLRPGADLPPDPIRYVVTERVGMSRTYGRTVLLPLDRVRDGRAPYLHETVHALLPASHGSTWLTEGLACHLESWVAENVGGYDAHVFTMASDRGIGEAARRYLATAAGRAVLPWVGVPGEPPGLTEDRAQVARPFYVLSHAFTKHLADRLGLAAVVRLAVAPDPEAGLASLTGRSPAQWRDEWLRGCGAGGLIPVSSPR